MAARACSGLERLGVRLADAGGYGGSAPHAATVHAVLRTNYRLLSSRNHRSRHIMEAKKEVGEREPVIIDVLSISALLISKYKPLWWLIRQNY
jgi:hypothetical protein